MHEAALCADEEVPCCLEVAKWWRLSKRRWWSGGRSWTRTRSGGALDEWIPSDEVGVGTDEMALSEADDVAAEAAAWQALNRRT